MNSSAYIHEFFLSVSLHELFLVVEWNVPEALFSLYFMNLSLCSDSVLGNFLDISRIFPNISRKFPDISRKFSGEGGKGDDCW